MFNREPTFGRPETRPPDWPMVSPQKSGAYHGESSSANLPEEPEGLLEGPYAWNTTVVHPSKSFRDSPDETNKSDSAPKEVRSNTNTQMNTSHLTIRPIEIESNKPYSDSEGVILETNTQTDASHLTMTPTGIESNNHPNSRTGETLEVGQFISP